VAATRIRGITAQIDIARERGEVEITRGDVQRGVLPRRIETAHHRDRLRRTLPYHAAGETQHVADIDHAQVRRGDRIGVLRYRVDDVHFQRVQVEVHRQR